MDLNIAEGKPGVLSIIVLTYNRKHMLRGCLDSLFSQTVPKENLEIIVVDDGSTDGTEDMMKGISLSHPRLKYCRQIHKGIPATRNTGVVNASGDIIAIVADDYLLAPDYAETIIRFFQENPGAMVVRFKVIAAEDDFFSRVSHFYFDVSVRRRLPCEEAGGKHWIENLKRKWQKLPIVEEQITTQHDLEAAGGAAFKREVFRIVGLFDESLLRAEDTDLTRRLRAKGILVYYYPYHRIRHRYGQRSVLDTVSKCFAAGRDGWSYHKKYSNDSVGVGSFRLILGGIMGKSGALLGAFLRARQSSSAGEFLLYIPFMFLFEISNKLGLFWGALMPKKKNTDSASRS
jgi:glycosyltransferase involved in cell wall biosynthesis